MKAIVIAHNKGGSRDWLYDLLDSIETAYPVVVTNHTGWVTDGLREASQYGFEEFVYLNESCVVKDNSLWELLFDEYAGKSVALSPRFLMFMGKFRKEPLDKLSFPLIDGKVADVLLGEGQLMKRYMSIEPTVTPFPEFKDSPKFENRHGRKNMVLENRYLKKWKGTWDVDMIPNWKEEVLRLRGKAALL